MIRQIVHVTNRLGLHARVAAQLVRLASKFRSEIHLSREGSAQISDARSILQILMMAAAQGTSLEIVIKGEDEDQAAEAIRRLFEDNFGEGQ